MTIVIKNRGPVQTVTAYRDRYVDEAGATVNGFRAQIGPQPLFIDDADAKRLADYILEHLPSEGAAAESPTALAERVRTEFVMPAGIVESPANIDQVVAAVADWIGAQA